MLSVLNAILCVLRNILLAVLWAGVELVNALVLALGALAAALLSVMPEMPDPPSSAAWAPTALGWVAWFVPVGGILAGLAVMIAAYLLFQLSRIALAWLKAL